MPENVLYLFFLFYSFGYVVHAVMHHIGILQHFIHRPVDNLFIIMVVNGRTDDFRYPPCLLTSGLHIPLILLSVPFFFLSSTVIIFPQPCTSHKACLFCPVHPSLGLSLYLRLWQAFFHGIFSVILFRKYCHIIDRRHISLYSFIIKLCCSKYFL